MKSRNVFMHKFLNFKIPFWAKIFCEDKNSLQTVKFETLLLAGGWAHGSLLADESERSYLLVVAQM